MEGKIYKKEMDKIKIQNLEIFANHGVFLEETKLGQKFLVSAVLYTDTKAAGMTDDLTKSIHYGEVSHFITDFMKKKYLSVDRVSSRAVSTGNAFNNPESEKGLIGDQKPWAPIGLPLESVSVEIERGWHEVYLSFGSNMGDREAYIKIALDALEHIRGCRLRQVSELLVTKPYGGVEQEDFLNGCLELETLLTPQELLEELHRIEQEAGRERKIHWGPRTLDLDILFYDKELIETEDLIIPHVDLENRYFVLKPLAEIAPNFRHPILKKTVTQMLEAVKEEA